MEIKTRAQQYAASAYDQVAPMAETWGSDDPQRKQYGSMAFKLPVLIRTAGLAQALAFVQARGKEPAQKLLHHIANTLGEGDAAALAARSRTENLSEYMQLTQKVLAVTIWYKRFAQSLLGYEPGNDDDNRGART